MTETFQVEPECAVALHADDLAHFLEELRFSVGRESHDLVFVPKPRETDELGNRRIKNTERMWKIYPVINLNGIASTQAPGGTGEIAKPVHRNAHSVVEWRHEKRGGQMGKMVLNVVNFGAKRLAG